MINNSGGMLGDMRQVGGKKKEEKPENWKYRFMEWMTGAIPGGKKIEKATEDRTGSESQRKKQFPKMK